MKNWLRRRAVEVVVATVLEAVPKIARAVVREWRKRHGG